jgi:hypothetical protein
MNGAVRVARAAIGAISLITSTAFAQETSVLASRLDKPTYTAVTAIVDSARIAKMPTKPLLDKALEGAARGMDGPTIVGAVQQRWVRMGAAKQGLGTSASPDEIRAAVSALEAGVAVRDLARLRAAGGRRPVTMPLAVLADLIARSVPVPTATDLVLQLTRSGVRDGDFSTFQRNVRADIENGADPTAAATTRARGIVRTTEPKPGRSE